MIRFAVTLLKSTSLAEEVVSDVFVKVWRNRKQLRNIKKLDLYLYKAVRNQALNQLRDEKMLLTDFEEAAIPSIVIQNPEQTVLDKELVMRLERSIRNLPRKCQAIFRLARAAIGYKPCPPVG